MAFNLKINKETQGSAGVPIPAPTKLVEPSMMYPTGYNFPQARLVKVSFNPTKEVGEDKVETPVLEFLFKDSKDRTFTLIEFPIEEDANKADMKVAALLQRIKHIWEQTIGESVEMDIEGADFAELFKNAAAAFNAQKVTVGQGDAAKERVKYAASTVYLKLVYYNSRLQVPMYPNFIQAATDGTKQIPCESLLINPSNDQIEPKAKPKATSSFSGAEAGYAGESMNMDLPDV